MNSVDKPFGAWAGTRTPRLLIVGEAWGEGEATLRKPFVGESGKELWHMLGEALPNDLHGDSHRDASAMHRYGLAWVQKRLAWMNAHGIAMTNVFNLRPPGGNDIANLCGSRKDVPKSYQHEPIKSGKYILEKYLPALDRLRQEIAESRPNLIICCGAIASWALLGNPKIGAIRGAVAQGNDIAGGAKCLPVYHPASVLRIWDWRPIVVADLTKAWRECEFPEIRRPERYVTVNPTIEAVEAFADRVCANPPPELACDIETGCKMIKCVGFGPSIREALVIPFVDLTHPSGSYWPTIEDELRAWRACQRLLACGSRIVGQNFLYDLQYLIPAGMRPINVTEDTMLLHHSMFPEMEKGLGFLGSIYTNEASWKLMNRRKADEVEKADE